MNADKLKQNLDDVRLRMAAACARAGRGEADVRLVAVTKTVTADVAAQLIEFGVTDIGENRVQEAETHWALRRPDVGDLELHLVGPLQTNKVRDAVALFDVIQTLDRQKLAEHLAREFDRTGTSRRCFIQVNTGEEPQKAGIRPLDADDFIRACRDEYGFPVRGLMCIPPADEEPAMHFSLLADIAQRHGLDWLSMGMSADFEEAIRFGATHVRVGTAVFGNRPSQ